MKINQVNSVLSNNEIQQFLKDNKLKNIHFQDFDDRMGSMVSRDIKYLLNYTYCDENLWNNLCPKHKENTEYKSNINAITKIANDLSEEELKLNSVLNDFKNITSLVCCDKLNNNVTEIPKDCYYNLHLIKSLYSRLAFIDTAHEKQEIKQKLENAKKEFNKNYAILTMLLKSNKYTFMDGDKVVKMDDFKFDNYIFEVMDRYRRNLNTLGWFLRFNKFFNFENNHTTNLEKFIDRFNVIKRGYYKIFTSINDNCGLTPIQVYGYDMLKFPTSNKNFIYKRIQYDIFNYVNVEGFEYDKGSQTFDLLMKNDLILKQ